MKKLWTLSALYFWLKSFVRGKSIRKNFWEQVVRARIEGIGKDKFRLRTKNRTNSGQGKLPYLPRVG